MNHLGNSVSMNYCLKVCVRLLTNYKVVMDHFYLSSDGVWAADNSGLGHSRMLNQGTFYLKRSNSVTGGGNTGQEFIKMSSSFATEHR